MLRKKWFCVTTAAVIISFTALSQAAAIVNGDINPNTLPNTWSSGTTVRIADSSNGSLTVPDTSVLTGTCFVGYNSDVMGEVNVSGTGSLTNSTFVLGQSGSGSLNVSQGGTASTGVTYLGNASTASGMANVSGDNSTWTTGNIYVGATGNGSVAITNNAEATSYAGYIGQNAGSTGEVTVSNATWTFNSNLSVGYYGDGYMEIANGSTVTSGNTSIGDMASATGEVIVSGAGTSWTVGSTFRVGYRGAGALHISDNATVSSNGTLNIGDNSGSQGVVTVSGANTTLDVSDINMDYNGRLNLTNGAKITTDYVEMSSGNVISIEVTGNDMLVVTDYGFANSGTIELSASPGLAEGTYTPISVTGGWPILESAAVAFGGTWNQSAKTFTVGSAVELTDGQQVDINLATQQRIDVDAGDLSVNFKATGSYNNLDFTATSTSGQTLADLQAELSGDESVQSSYDFDIAGLPGGDLVQLTFAVNEELLPEDITIWHFDGTWSEYTPTDLVVADGFATFTVNSFSSYAVTGVTVPEPATIALLAAGGIALLRRKKKA